jgi:hypothetical protein
VKHERIRSATPDKAAVIAFVEALARADAARDHEAARRAITKESIRADDHLRPLF